MAGIPFRKTSYTPAISTHPPPPPAAPPPLAPATTIPTFTIRTSSGSFAQQLLQRSPPAYASLPDRPRTVPMSIPNARESPPPPLPPPRYIDDIVEGGDPGWHFANRNRSNSSVSASIRPGSSLLGGSSSKSARSGYTGPERNVDFGARDENLKSLLEYSREEERSESLKPQPQIPDLAALLEYNKLKSESQLGQKNLEKSSHAYDKHLLSRIGNPRTPPRPGSGLLSMSLNSSSNEDSPTSRTEQHTLKQLNAALRPLSMPERRHSDMGSAGAAPRWGARAPPSSAVSPGFSGLRSPLSEHGAERVLPSRTSTLASIEDTSSFSGRLSHRQSYDQTSTSSYTDAEFTIGDRPDMSDLAIHDRSPSISDDMPRASRAGQKRRAQSPPSDSVIDPRLPASNSNNNNNNTNNQSGGESWQKRSMHDASGRSPQVARLNANSASLSSTATSTHKNGSYNSSYGTSNPSTAATSYSDRPSPSTFQTPENSVSSPRSTMNQPLTSQSAAAAAAAAAAVAAAAPPPPIQSGQPLHRRTTSSSNFRVGGLFICDCCPKKPKKFETEHDLHIHEMEKQYICQYCHNRFKNKNEAERHQNSLHLRRHSWSCAALTSFEAAFHPTPNGPMTTPGLANPPNSHHPHYITATDTCGYCGQEFPNPPDWVARVEHLNMDHKFGECNQSKKFFRADHFRQHLKHSHAGSSGKWTNMLENACMKDEPAQPMSAQSMPMHMQGIMVGPQGSLAAPGGVISGMHQQSNSQAPMASMVSPDGQGYHGQPQAQQDQQTSGQMPGLSNYTLQAKAESENKAPSPNQRHQQEQQNLSGAAESRSESPR